MRLLTALFFSLLPIIAASSFAAADNEVITYKVNSRNTVQTRCVIDGENVGRWHSCVEDRTCSSADSIIVQCRTRYGQPDRTYPRWTYMIDMQKQSDYRCVRFGVFVGNWYDCREQNNCNSTPLIMEHCKTMRGGVRN